MTMDRARLRVVSKLFTEETLKTILIAGTGEKSVQVTGWDFGEASAKGDSYLSTVDRITLLGTAGDREISYKIVVKSLPQNIGRRKTYRSTDFFANEIYFYSQVIPAYKKFLESKNQSHLLLVPNCLAFVLDGVNDFIALADLSVDGFGCVSRQSTVSLDEAKLILKALARFHGVSFAFKNQHELEFDRVASTLTETYFSENNYDWYKTFQERVVGIAKDAMSKEFPGTPEEKKFTNFTARELWEKSVAVCSRSKTPTSIINQGDCWAPNFLMRRTSGELEAALLDFQLARCCGPVADLAFFIYSCTDKQLRDREFDNLLKYYHTELTKTVSALGSNAEQIYPWTVFIQEIQNEFGHGMCFGLESILFSMLDESENFDLDIIKGDKPVNIADIWTLKPIKDQSKRRRLADVIMHALEHKYL